MSGRKEGERYRGDLPGSWIVYLAKQLRTKFASREKAFVKAFAVASSNEIGSVKRCIGRA